MRLLQTLVDLLDLKIINKRAIDLTNINTVVDDNLTDEKKTMAVCGGKAQ